MTKKAMTLSTKNCEENDMKEVRVYTGERLEGLYITNDMINAGWSVESEKKLAEEQYQIIFTREKNQETEK